MNTKPVVSSVTPAAQKRQEDKEAAVIFLAERLFGWRSVRFERDGYGKTHKTTTGSTGSVKGYFGIDPASGQEGLFRYQIDNDITASRKIVAIMAEHGFAFVADYIPGGTWKASFITPIPGGERDFSAEDMEEAFSVCLAAEKAIRANVVKITPIPEMKRGN